VKISLDWISDFVDLSDLKPEVIANRFTLATAEVEGFEVIRRSVDGVLVGEVVEVQPLEGSESGKLRLAVVDLGDRRVQTVCGAPNLRVGMKSAFAPVGTTLAGGVRIEASQMAGRESQGVLCSAAELGLSRWHEIALECPADLDNGSPLSDYIPPGDVIIEIDNKSLTHRPDLWGHYGLAREFAAVFGRPLRELPLLDFSLYEELPRYPLSVDDFDGCPAYGCIEFSIQANVPSPLAIQRRLHALGQRTYNLMVDLTNYVMWELGQPTHAFDGDRLRAVRVARMGKPGTFFTLDGQERKMLPDDLLIWNENEPVALAGIMGGLNSEVQPATAKVLLESANFKASQIRRTSVRLDLRSESAQRFEKSQPPVNVKYGAARILQLITDAGVPFEVTSSFTWEGDLKDDYRPLSLAPGVLRRIAGVDLPEEEVLGILQSLGFQADVGPEGGLQVGIPPHRSEKDLSIPEDIAEEVLRVYGYDKISPKLPVAPMQPLRINEALRVEHKVERLLAGSHRFVQVQNYAWTDDGWLAQLGFEPKRTLVLKNPAAQQNRLLRTTLIPNLLKLVPQNRTHRDAFRLFEIGHVYSLGDDGHSIETNRLGGVSYQQAGQPTLEEHLRAIKGVLEDLAVSTGLGRFQFVPCPGGEAPWQVPYHWVSIRAGDRELGGLGVLAGPIQDAVVPEGGQVVWFELAMEGLQGSIYPVVKYVPAPVYPGSWQDFSLVWDVARGFAALDETVGRFDHALVTGREFVYAYKGKGMPPGKGSYTYRFWLGAADHTLTSDEIEGFRSALLTFLQAENIPLR
jgi:phenylalanyl-tRNA synthetase beta chain